MILVTGATGLVGSHLLMTLLQEQNAVKALYRDEKSIDQVRHIFQHQNHLSLFDKIIWIKGDITDIPSLTIAFQNVSKVFHCAALISFDPKDEELLRKTNIEGTANIVNCCIDFKVDKLCYVSSIAALGDTKENETIVTEETEWNPEKLHGDYAISKFGAEMEVWRGFQEGLNVVIVNPGVIFGYGFPEKGSGVIVNSVKKGNPFYTNGLIGIIAVEDVVNCMTNLMNSSISGERFTLVSENLSYLALFKRIADNLNIKPPYLYANRTLTSFAWRADWFLAKITGKKRTFTKATAKASHSKIFYSNEKAQKTLNYTFTDMEKYFTLYASF